MVKPLMLGIIGVVVALPVWSAVDDVPQTAIKDENRVPTVLERAARTGVQIALSYILEAPATVGDVRFDQKAGMLKLSNVKIGNPKGFDDNKPAISLGEVYVEATPNLLTDAAPIIHIVKLTGATVNAEQSFSEGINLKKLFDSASRLQTLKVRPGLRPKSQKALRIEKGVLQECTLNLTTQLLTSQTKTWKLKPIEMDFTEMGGPNGIPADQVLAKALDRLMQEVTSPGVGEPATGEPPTVRIIDLLR